jgi:alcohol dehydrogenase YqhD (iron-dependent ADH family)
MIDFDFVSPTRIIFGHKSEEKVADILKSYGFKSVLMVYGGGSIVRSGLYAKVVQLLDGAKIAHVELSGITPNPDKSFVVKGKALAEKNHCDCLLAIGGGSVIDVAKAIGVSLYYEGDPFDFNLHKAKPAKCLPVGVIPHDRGCGKRIERLLRYLRRCDWHQARLQLRLDSSAFRL